MWKHKAFPLFVSLWGSKTEENAAESFRERPQPFLSDSLSFLKPSLRKGVKKAIESVNIIEFYRELTVLFSIP